MVFEKLDIAEMQVNGNTVINRRIADVNWGDLCSTPRTRLRAPVVVWYRSTPEAGRRNVPVVGRWFRKICPFACMTALTAA
jgi:hypothetical protein